MDETLNPDFSSDLEQNEGTCDIGFNRGCWLVDTAIHVRLGRKVNHDVAAAHSRFHRDGIADIPFNKPIVRILRDRFEVSEISGVGQLVIIKGRVVLAESQDMVNEIGADEARAARYENLHWLTSCRSGISVPFACGILFAPVFATRLLARSKESNVPASVHQ